jgi:hypothetical protein
MAGACAQKVGRRTWPPVWLLGGGVSMSSSPAMALEKSWVTSKACQRLLEPNAVTAQFRLAKYDIKGSPGFSIFVPGDLHTNNLGDFLAVRYTALFTDFGYEKMIK